ncbi:acetyl-CoA synthetase-like protein [Aspergillus ellipticus CBS 707.79]|uniref:Acetyl-CoA synthetase-like protein n=1 Tax=Aspergillus ellipticus CBS 707.79 TaxID=1448320 RepID=A0A319DV73_9EURO|nr:acetyl-CoA synthetase-like protein [Aspergillus ellipticus CBS 707.79]
MCNTVRVRGDLRDETLLWARCAEGSSETEVANLPRQLHLKSTGRVATVLVAPIVSRILPTSKRSGPRELRSVERCHIDRMAAFEPLRPAIHQVIPDQPEATAVRLPFRDLANLVNRLAWWLDGLSKKGSTISYLAPSDLRHILLCLASAKVGVKILLLSSRNSTEVNDHLLKTVQCHTVLFDGSLHAAVSELKTEPLEAIEVSDLLEPLQTPTPVDKYPCINTLSAVEHEPFAFLHTSGSTGLPKPVIMAHGAIAAQDAQLNLSSSGQLGEKIQTALLAEAQRPYISFPLFHVAGLALSCPVLFSGSALVFGYPNRPPSCQIFKDVLRLVQADAAVIPPLIVDRIPQDPPLFNSISSDVNFILTGGGQVSQKAGNIVSRKTKLLIGMGSTETLALPQLMPESDNWHCFHFAKAHGSIEWHPAWDTSRDVETPEDEIYELVIHRSDEFEEY